MNLLLAGILIQSLAFADGMAKGTADVSVQPETGIDWSADLCVVQKEFLNTQIKNRISIEQLTQKIAADSPKIVFVGESHIGETADNYTTFFASLKKAVPGINCVAFEASSKNSSNGMTRKPWQELSEYAKKNWATSTHLVDGPCADQDTWKDDQPPANDFLALNRRNHCMAEHLEELIKSGKCSKILMINGFYHLQDNYLNKRPSLPRRISEKNISNFTILAIDVSDGNKREWSERHDPWIWPKGPSDSTPLCKNVPGATGKSYASLNAQNPFAKRVPVTYINSKLEGTSGPLSDFDAVLMFSH